MSKNITLEDLDNMSVEEITEKAKESPEQFADVWLQIWGCEMPVQLLESDERILH